RAATAFSLGSNRPLGAGRFAYRSAGMVFEPACGHWLRLGVLSGPHTISARCGQTSGLLPPNHRVPRYGYGFIPTPVSGPLSSNVAPALTVIGHRTRMSDCEPPRRPEWSNSYTLCSRSHRGQLVT